VVHQALKETRLKAYEYDRTPPHLYLGEIDATPDPFEADVWRAPAFAVFEAPPDPQPGYTVIRVGFDDGAWELVEDHRGEVGYTADGSAVLIRQVGPITEPVVTQTPPPGPHHIWSAGSWQAEMEPMRESKLREIDAARDIAIISGFDYNGVRFDSDAKSIQRISGAVTLSMLNPAYVTEWITFDNSTVTLDAAGLAGLGVAAGLHESSQVFKARGLKNAVLAATTVEEIQSITW
jgi:hypothetical protein